MIYPSLPYSHIPNPHPKQRSRNLNTLGLWLIDERRSGDGDGDGNWLGGWVGYWKSSSAVDFFLARWLFPGGAGLGWAGLCGGEGGVGEGRGRVGHMI